MNDIAVATPVESDRQRRPPDRRNPEERAGRLRAAHRRRGRRLLRISIYLCDRAEPRPTAISCSPRTAPPSPSTRFRSDYLRGSKIDFVDDLMGRAFKIDNPAATASCGCGTSFSLD